MSRNGVYSVTSVGDILTRIREKYPVTGLITVFGAILTGRQSGQKLQCLYGNPMANNFFQIKLYAIYVAVG